MPSSIPFTVPRTVPKVAPGYLDLRSLNWKSEEGEDDPDSGAVTVSGFGAGVNLKGDRWICADLSEVLGEITPTTILEFEFWCSNAPAPGDFDRPDGGHFTELDIAAIGLGESADITLEPESLGELTQQWIFQVYGTLRWERGFYCGLFGAGEVGENRENSYRNREPVDLGVRWEKYEVCLGSIDPNMVRQPKFLYLIARHKRNKRADVRFRSIRIYDDPTVRQFPETAEIAFTEQDVPSSVYEQKYSGFGAKISQNAWKVIEIDPVEVTTDTYFDCWIRAEVEGELSGLGLVPENDPDFPVRNGEMAGDMNSFLDAYGITLSGKQSGFPLVEPFPYGYREWVHIRLFLDETDSPGKTCKYLVIYCDDDVNPKVGTLELMLFRIKELEEGVFPYIGTDRKFLSGRGLSISKDNKLNSWANIGSERFELATRGTSALYPDVDLMSSNDFILSSRKIPTLTGNGGRMVSQGNLLSIPQRYYAHWAVAFIPFLVQGDPTQTIFELRGRNSTEGMRLDVRGGAEFTMFLDYINTTTRGETFTLSAEIPIEYVNDRAVICVYKEAGIDQDYTIQEDDGTFILTALVPRIQYRIRVNTRLLPEKQSFDPDLGLDYFDSTLFYLSLFGDYEGVNPFLSDVYAFITTQRRNDICNARGVNRRLMNYYGIPY